MRAHALPGWLLSTCSIATTSRRSTTTTTTLVLNRCYCARQMSSVASTSASTNSSQAEHPPQQSDPRRPSRSPAGEKKPPQRLDLGGGSSSSYPIDDYTNVTPTIASKIGRNIHLEPNHPIGILRKMIESHFSTFEAINALSPIVTVEKNFDELGFAADHPGRNLTDSYYINRKHMLRTHTSAHEVETFKRQSLDRWLLTADVYRRDEIDASHYPVFHQMEGSHVVDKGDATRVFEASNQELERKLSNANIRIVDETRINDSNSYQMEHDPVQAEIVARNLKNNLNSLVLDLFGPVAASRGNTTGSSGGSAAAAATSSSNEPLQVRWIEAFFPWTSPSYEVEVFFEGKWLEILGCGVVRQKTLDTAGVSNKIGWAFGLGLERIAMVLFGIPDIRLFWSQDPRFTSQFKQGQITSFKPYSKQPPCYQDISFWLEDDNDNAISRGREKRQKFHENDFCEIVRDVAGDLAEETKLIDEFVHPKTSRKSLCYRINYRSMDKNITTREAEAYTLQVKEIAAQKLGIEIR